MIVYSGSFKPKGFGIKKYLKLYKNDIAVVSDKKISKRKLRKIKNYIISVSKDKLLNNSHLDINSYGCFSKAEIVSQICEMLFKYNDTLSLNDPSGYAAEAVKKYIRNFSSARIYGHKIYNDIQEQLYHKNGVCIIIAHEKINNATDTNLILETAENTAYLNDGVYVSYLDMLMHYGTEWNEMDKFISIISRCKNP